MSVDPILSFAFMVEISVNFKLFTRAADFGDWVSRHKACSTRTLSILFRSVSTRRVSKKRLNKIMRAQAICSSRCTKRRGESGLYNQNFGEFKCFPSFVLRTDSVFPSLQTTRDRHLREMSRDCVLDSRKRITCIH